MTCLPATSTRVIVPPATLAAELQHSQRQNLWRSLIEQALLAHPHPEIQAWATPTFPDLSPGS